MVCDSSREGILEYLTCANEECVTYGYEIIVKNRVCVWFSEKGVGSIVGGGTGKRPFVIINSMELSMVSSNRPL